MPPLLRSAVVFFLLTVPAAAGENRDVFTGVLQGLAGEIDRETTRQQHEANALLQACFDGSGPACDIAIQNSWLSPSARRAVRDQRNRLDAQRRAEVQTYERFAQQWTACRDQRDAKACDAAMRYDRLGDDDRQTLLSWRDDALRAQDQDRAAEQARREAEAVAATNNRPAIADVPVTTGSIAVAAQPIAGAPDVGDVSVLLLVIGICAAFLAWAGRVPRSASYRPADADFADRAFAAEPARPLTGHFPTDVRRALAC